jgi:PBSX family phage terminase large subunit
VTILEQPNNVWRPHSEKQDRAIFSKKPIIAVCTGTQWGKTRCGAIRMMIEMFKYTDPYDTFLITAPTYKILNQSTLPAFLQIMQPFGEYNKGSSEYKIHGGGTCYMRTATDPDSIVGITNCRFIWGDEAGKYPLYFWENIIARAAFRSAPIMLTTSPYALNWLFKDIVRPMQKNPNSRPDVELIQARSDENPYYPIEIFNRNKQTMDERRFNQLFGGQFERMEGLVYDCFDTQLNTCPLKDVPPGAEIIAGIDWGYTNPFAVTVVAKTDDCFYVIKEVYKTNQTITGMIDICRNLQIALGVSKFYCDPSAPAYIEEFNRNKLSAIGAKNDIREGIDRVYELMKSKRLKIVEEHCPHLIDEIETYHYPEEKDLNVDTNVKELLPVAQANHAIDSLRYCIISTYFKKSYQPIVPGVERYKRPDTARKVAEHIRKEPINSNFYEKWE